WKRAIGPYWTGAWAGVGDFYRDGRKSIVVYQYSNRKSFPNQDKIQILDAHDGLPLEEKGHGNQFTAATVQPQLQICRDFNGDGKDEIVVGNTDGFVRLLDGKLTELRPSKPYQKRVTIEAVEDLDGDGFWEVVCVLPNDQIVVLDNQLQELCHWLITAPASETYLQVVHAGNKNHLLVISTFPDHNEYQLLECQTSPVPFPAISSAKKAAPWIGLTLLLITVAIVIRNLFFGEKARTMLPSLLEEANLMDRALLMNRQGKITRVGRYWSTILQLPPHTLVGKNWQQIFSAEPLLPLKQAVTDIFQKRFPETSVTFSPGEAERQIPIKLKSLYLPFIQMYCLMIFDLTEEEHIRQVKHWAQVAQKLAHSIKNPLTTVKLSAEELRHRLKEYYQIQEKELDEFFDDMIGQVTRLKRMSDEFMRFVEFEQPILMPVDLNTEVKELVLHWQPERSSRIHIDWELGENLPPALIDREQFAHALRNVFFNAVESLKDGGRILISTQKAQLFPEDGESHTGATYIGLQIRDTGCGIPPEYLDKVTQPWFTYNKPEGSGLGLSIVQKVMDSHGGKFDIQSEMGKGTTVTLWFRVKR
ncbi:MAG: ATP-binding protein, partial [candidate division KSB1 bacterium]|nr:ATP-binding protein [candidate division KSB1 bacterium]